MLSDEGDLYSDEEDGTVYGGDLRNSNGDKIIPTAADRRAHHNALERKRRDHIKDSFTSLRDSVPSLQGEKVTVSASRAQILKKAAEYIQFMRKKNNNVQSDIDEIAKQNKMLEDQIRRMEKAKNGGGGSVGSGGLSSLHLAGSSGGSSSSAAASSVGNGVGGGGGGGSPLLYTEQIEVSTSYDTSEQDSNGSCSNSNGPMQIIQQQQQPMQPMHSKPAKIGAGGSGSFSGAGISIISAASILEGGSGSSSSSSPSSSSSNSSPFSTLSPSPVTATYSAGPSSSSLKSGGTVLINGGGGSTNGTLRPVMQLAKNGSLTAMGGGGGGGSGTSKIIVQNPQHKNGGQPHVIHVTTSPAASAMLANGVGLGGLGGLGVGGGNITAMSSSGKPIIITSAQLSAAAANGTLTVINGQNGKCK